MCEPAAVSPLEAALERAASAEALAAELGLALDLLGRLVGVPCEEGVAAAVLECAQVLFGAGRARLTLLDRSGRPSRAFERGPDGTFTEDAVRPPLPTPDTVELGPDSVTVPVTLERRPLGVLTVSDLFSPKDLDRYAVTIVTVAHVAAMALANARAVRGLVQICAQCRRVRNGQDAWEPLETWIAAHSEAQLSHGLCPACYRAALLDAGLEVDGRSR